MDDLPCRRQGHRRKLHWKSGRGLGSSLWGWEQGVCGMVIPYPGPEVKPLRGVWGQSPPEAEANWKNRCKIFIFWQYWKRNFARYTTKWCWYSFLVSSLAWVFPLVQEYGILDLTLHPYTCGVSPPHFLSIPPSTSVPVPFPTVHPWKNRKYISAK